MKAITRKELTAMYEAGAYELASHCLKTDRIERAVEKYSGPYTKFVEAYVSQMDWGKPISEGTYISADKQKYPIYKRENSEFGNCIICNIANSDQFDGYWDFHIAPMWMIISEAEIENFLSTFGGEII